MKSVFIILLFLFITSFSFQDTNEHHRWVKNADMVLSIRIDSIRPSDSVVIYTAHASFDTSSIYYEYLPAVALKVFKEGPPSISGFDGGKNKTIKPGKKL